MLTAKAKAGQAEGNDRFEARDSQFIKSWKQPNHILGIVDLFVILEQGFCVDLLEHIAELAGFNYRIELGTDGKYGAFYNSSGEWNGLVRGEKKTDGPFKKRTIRSVSL